MFNTRDWIIQQGLQHFEQTQQDDQWLKSWLEQKRPRRKFTLSDYRQRLCHHARLLENYRIALKQKNNEDLARLKQEIEQSDEMIYPSDVVRQIQIQIRQRKTKRERIRRQKLRNPVKTSKTNIDVIINPSTSKKSFLEKIDDIRTILRQIDQRQQQTQCETIRQQLSDLERLCTEKIDEYEREREKQSDIDLYNHLFNNQRRSFYESSESRAQRFLRAHQNRSNLIEIRQQWDQFLSSTSNDIEFPSEWYTVTSTADSTWAKFIFERTNNS